jgi:hypothetical protein
VPDGENTEPNESGEGGTPEQEPLTPEEQLGAEIDLAKVTNQLYTLVGAPDQQYAAGGGGDKGKFVFADLAELDSVISMWEKQALDIEDDRQHIQSALNQIQDPAGDIMSRVQAQTSRGSLDAMLEHNRQMAKYTTDYINRLRQSREEMANQDASGSGQMNAVY